MVRLLRRMVLSAGAALPALALAHRVGAATSLDLPVGTPVYQRDTPHIYLVGADQQLHWIGDTRALEGKSVRWDQRQTWSYSQLARAPVGDPYLSAGLLKDGDPIYLVKWEHDWERPKLLHIPSIRDVEVFGINASNYGRFVMDKASWEARYGFTVADLQRDRLQPATWGRWYGFISTTVAKTWSGRPDPYAKANADWPAILLPYQTWPGLGLACQRGTDRWAAMISWPWTGNLGDQINDEPNRGDPHIAYSMHGLARLSAPQLWRGGHHWQGGWHHERIASFTDIPSRPYAKQLLDTILGGVAEGQYGLTLAWQQNEKEWHRELDVSGIETALAWLRVERSRPTPPTSEYFQHPGGYCPGGSNLYPEDQARCSAE